MQKYNKNSSTGLLEYPAEYPLAKESVIIKSEPVILMSDITPLERHTAAMSTSSGCHSNSLSRTPEYKRRKQVKGSSTFFDIPFQCNTTSG